MNVASGTAGRRVLVDGMMGSGKSTFARALSAKTGLPLIHLDSHYWKPGWYGRPTTSGGNDKALCLRATLGSSTATTTRRFHSGSNERKPSSTSTLLGGCARVALLREGFAPPAARCPMVARTRANDACATSGVVLGGFGVAVDRTATERAPRSCGTGVTRRFTCSVRGGRRRSFSMPSAASGRPPHSAITADLLAQRASFTDRGVRTSLLFAVHVATHVATSVSSPSLAHVRRVRDLRKYVGVTLSERHARDYGSEGWGFDSLRAR